MNRDALKTYLESHGSHLGQWPWSLRLPLLWQWCCSAKVRTLLRSARHEEHVLYQTLTPPPLPSDLLERLQGIPAAHPQRRPQPTIAPQTSPLLPLALSFTVACTAIGVVIGASGWLALDELSTSQHLVAVSQEVLDLVWHTEGLGS